MCLLFGNNCINVKIYIQDTMKDLILKQLISGRCKLYTLQSQNYRLDEY